MIKDIVVLGGGTAGFTAALTLKRKLPTLNVRVVRSPDIGIIGVGEGTNMTFPAHLLDTLRIPLPRLMSLIEPTLKLGLRFLWGPQREFFYAFAVEHAARLPSLKRANWMAESLSVPTATQWAWVGAVLAAGMLASLVPGIRAYRLSLADGLSPRS